MPNAGREEQTASAPGLAPIEHLLSSPLAWLIRPGLRQILARGRIPDPEDLSAVLATPVQFVRQEKKKKARSRRARATTAPLASYEERIVRGGEVPTRPSNLHDLLNALVFAALPNAKRALYARTLRARRLRPDPRCRCREEDLLAMLDEGGVVLLRGAPPAVLGHAVYEHLANGQLDVRCASIQLDAVTSGIGRHPADHYDQSLAAWLERAELQLESIYLRDLLSVSDAAGDG